MPAPDRSGSAQRQRRRWRLPQTVRPPEPSRPSEQAWVDGSWTVAVGLRSRARDRQGRCNQAEERSEETDRGSSLRQHAVRNGSAAHKLRSLLAAATLWLVSADSPSARPILRSGASASAKHPTPRLPPTRTLPAALQVEQALKPKAAGRCRLGDYAGVLRISRVADRSRALPGNSARGSYGAGCRTYARSRHRPRGQR